MGNTFGEIFKVTTAGESHGDSLVAIVDGCPALLELNEAIIQKDLDRRKPGNSKYTTARNESDTVKILSGTFEGKTTGTPIALLIKNEDHKSRDYNDIKDIFRPSHADYTYFHKYKIRDYRGGGRSSARETAMRVAAGSIARHFLKTKLNIEIFAYLSEIGNIKIPFLSLTHIEENGFFAPNNSIIKDIEEYLDDIKKQRDSIGAKVSLLIKNVPVGLGEPVFNKLDAKLAYALMGINAAKGVEIGSGFAATNKKGSENRDEIHDGMFLSNNAGGILGGISSGQDITANVAFKATPSIAIPSRTIDIFGNNTQISTKGRHDPCVGIRAVPIVEAMSALVLMDAYLINNSYH